MADLLNLARMTTATTGTGPVTLDTVATGFLSFDDAGVQDGHTVTYVIEDGLVGGVPSSRELGRGTYTAAGTVLSRDTVLKSTSGGSKLDLSGAAIVTITAAAEDLVTTGITAVASAATCDIGGAPTLLVLVTGTTGPITSFSNMAGEIRIGWFAGIVDLTNSSALVLPNGADWTTYANQMFIAAGDASGNVHVALF